MVGWRLVCRGIADNHGFMQWRIRITKFDIMNKNTIELQTVNDALQPPLHKTDVLVAQLKYTNKFV